CVKSSAVTAADAPNQRQQQHTTPLNNQTITDPTSQVPSLAPTVTSTENTNQAEMIAKNAQVENDEFINIFYTPIQDRGETSSHHVDSSNMHTFYQHHPFEHRWTKDHPLEQVFGNPLQSVRTRRQLESDGEMLQTPGSGISILLAVGTPSTGSGNLYCKWELSPGTSTITARPKVNTAAIRPNVNAKSSYFKPHFPKRRHFNQRSAAKTNTFSRKLNTAKGKNVTTARLKAVVNTAEGKKEMLLSNKSFLTGYQEIDGGFIAFGGSLKGGKITGKAKIRTGKLDFEDVYFVKELKFNLFSVSQMCDKKNSILFTETECLFLSPDIKLLDESQVLLKVPRQNNMYSFDLKNVVPIGDLTCLFAKATIDESNLWHKRLGHINFKTLNKLVRGNFVRDHLGKFDGKDDEGFLGGYSVNSKAFRVFNSRTRKVKDNMHVNFLEIKPNVAGSGPESLFDIDSLTKSMNYEPVFIGNQSNGDAGDVDEISRNDNVCQGNEIRIDSSTHAVNAASPSINIGSNITNAGSLNINTADSNHSNMPTLEAIGIFNDRDLGAKADINNLDSFTVVSLIPTTRVHKDHLKEQIIGGLNLNTQSRRMINFFEETAMVNFITGREEQIIKIFRTACLLVSYPK
nr:ribonuclease H-like domain-containing protein [Tanacetum cinerariifolium]